jgi:hypothetical protein
MFRRLLAIAIVSSACERAPTPAPQPSTPAKGLPEVQRARQGVENAQKAAEKRTDDALDRAMQGEKVERGAVPR